ncbi:MAG: 30S ribosomal protein S14 [Aeromicrobium sp.]|uniref:30S ribosomal protein S14 n=1 Tax=Aeromicrobium sp. TaxID=1871063 RepID=UPI0039E24CCA
MAKRSKIVQNERRKQIVERYAERRAELRKASKDESLPMAERMAASRALAKLPRDSAAIRVRKRDQVDGRPRGHVGKAGLSRIRFRNEAHAGHLPGITKSSW